MRIRPTSTTTVSECRAVLQARADLLFRTANETAERARLLGNGSGVFKGEARALQDKACELERDASAIVRILWEVEQQAEQLNKRKVAPPPQLQMISLDAIALRYKPQGVMRADFWLLAALEARREGDEAQATVRELAATLQISETKVRAGLARLHQGGLIEAAMPREGEFIPRFRIKTKFERAPETLAGVGA